jgi:uncharacterized protein YyaL (SSP411 family)
MHTNRLAREKSPYLLQHQHNPVDWYPWNEEAFAKARAEDKPIFLSVGYSTCHWCHVMERESFENERIAEQLNRGFVSIKVDREERPDIDRIYMHFVQATTGGGGWPMSVWLTPDLKPFYGGTYFPPEDRWGRAGFPQVLEAISEAWNTDRERVIQSSGQMLEQLREQTAFAPARSSLHAGTLESAFFQFRRSFDSRLGGFGPAPKFPRPAALNFLLRYHARSGNEEALEMAVMTLRAMARGGMRDHLGGGFHRYSVDEFWFVPHFEKMLYDQAQLAVSYLEAYQITGDLDLADVARSIFDYVLRDLRHSEGGFYSAEDADSVTDPAHPHEKGEGAFYIWSAREIEDILGLSAAGWFGYRYGVEEKGNVRNDPQGEFTGRNILFSSHSVEETAAHFGRDVEEMRAALSRAAGQLLEARSRRIRPHLDDKILASWNGLMISAFAKGGAILDEPRYGEAARRAADFIRSRMYGGVLYRRFRDGAAAIPGFLDDYAYFTQALIDLYEAQFDARDLEFAGELAGRMRERFEDREHGGFYSTAEGDGSLLLRMKDDYDGAEPSGNSIAVLALLRLARMTENEEFRRSAEAALEAFASRLQQAPTAAPQMLVAYDFSLSPPRQVVIAGDRRAPDTAEMVKTLHARFLPQHVALLVNEDSRPVLASWSPTLAAMDKVDHKAAAYVCENFTCRLPTNDPVELTRILGDIPAADQSV